MYIQGRKEGKTGGFWERCLLNMKNTVKVTTKLPSQQVKKVYKEFTKKNLEVFRAFFDSGRLSTVQPLNWVLIPSGSLAVRFNTGYC